MRSLKRYVVKFCEKGVYMSANFGYIRVSTKEQNIDRQKEELIKQGADESRLFIDYATGKNTDRVALQHLLQALQDGDTLYIHELDRLGRSKRDIISVLKEIHEKGVTVRILDIPTTLIDLSSFGDLTKPIMDMINNLLIEVYATLAEAELKKMQKRQKEGIEAAQKRGVKFGRPKHQIDKGFIKIYNLWQKKEVSSTMAWQLLGLKKDTFYRLVKEYQAELKKKSAK